MFFIYCCAFVFAGWQHKLNRMSNKIKLELTKAQFDALMALAEETAISITSCDDEPARIALRRVKLVNKALKQNRINYTIGY